MVEETPKTRFCYKFPELSLLQLDITLQDRLFSDDLRLQQAMCLIFQELSNKFEVSRSCICFPIAKYPYRFAIVRNKRGLAGFGNRYTTLQTPANLTILDILSYSCMLDIGFQHGYMLVVAKIPKFCTPSCHA